MQESDQSSVKKEVVKIKRHDNIRDNDGDTHTIFTFENPNDVIGKHFYKGIYWEIHNHVHMKKMMQGCAKNSVALDIGGNIGTHTVYMKKFGNVWTFEPQKETFEILQANNDINPTEYKTRLFNVALSERRSNTFRMIKPTTEPTRNNNGGLGISETNDGEQIETVSFDEIWERYGKPEISFIKMDVEGHELSVLKGMRKFLREMTPPFLFEDWYAAKGTSPVFEFFERRGYVIKRVENSICDFLAIPSKRKNEFKEYVDYVYTPPSTHQPTAQVKKSEVKKLEVKNVKCEGDPDEFYYAIGVSIAAALLFFVPQKFPSGIWKVLFGVLGLALAVPIVVRMEDFWEFACVSTKLFVLGSMLLHVVSIFVASNIFDFQSMRVIPAFLFMVQLLIFVEVILFRI